MTEMGNDSARGVDRMRLERRLDEISKSVIGLGTCAAFKLAFGKVGRSESYFGRLLSLENYLKKKRTLTAEISMGGDSIQGLLLTNEGMNDKLRKLVENGGYGFKREEISLALSAPMEGDSTKITICGEGEDSFVSDGGTAVVAPNRLKRQDWQFGVFPRNAYRLAEARQEGALLTTKGDVSLEAVGIDSLFIPDESITMRIPDSVFAKQEKMETEVLDEEMLAVKIDRNGFTLENVQAQRYVGKAAVVHRAFKGIVSLKLNLDFYLSRDVNYASVIADSAIFFVRPDELKQLNKIIRWQFPESRGEDPGLRETSFTNVAVNLPRGTKIFRVGSRVLGTSRGWNESRIYELEKQHKKGFESWETIGLDGKLIAGYK